MTWTAANGHESCGVCGRRLERDEPMAVLALRMRRCAPCLSPLTPDWDAVYAEIEARRAQRTGEPTVNVRQSFGRLNESDFHRILRDGGGIRGRKRPRPFSEVAADLPVVRSGGGE